MSQATHDYFNNSKDRRKARNKQVHSVTTMLNHTINQGSDQRVLNQPV